MKHFEITEQDRKDLEDFINNATPEQLLELDDEMVKCFNEEYDKAMEFEDRRRRELNIPTISEQRKINIINIEKVIKQFKSNSLHNPTLKTR